MIFFEDFNASAKGLLSSSLKLRRSHTISPFNDIALLHYYTTYCLLPPLCLQSHCK
ncbi:hypothetical protein OTSKARP_0125 [Orientia tsutsugamushi str. Karp]|nr:hypothetical protein OTSKARP_0125 [Orientia tsutsugamushi str. Karp]